MLISWQRLAGRYGLVLCSRTGLLYLSILPEVEAELIHILMYPVWNGVCSCRTCVVSPVWYCVSLVPKASHPSVACSTNTKAWKPEMKYCRQAKYSNSLHSLVEEQAMDFHARMIRSVSPYTMLYQKHICRCRWHCYSCFTLITITRQQTHIIFRYSFLL